MNLMISDAFSVKKTKIDVEMSFFLLKICWFEKSIFIAVESGLNIEGNVWSHAYLPLPNWMVNDYYNKEKFDIDQYRCVKC